jgi:hypothetical protein
MSQLEIGRVAGLWRYPVKSMAAQSLEAADVSWHGLTGDRRWAFVRPDMPRSGFPWLTARERPEMACYRPWFVDRDRPDASTTVVTTPAGDDLDVVDPTLAAALGDGVRVLRYDCGVFDTMPLSLVTTQAVGALGGMVGAPLDARRFRPNVLIEAAGEEPFAEDAWVGRVLHVGGLRVRVDKRDQRCVMVNVDPTTAARDPAVLRAIARERQSCFGVYGSTVVPGRVAVGDTVTVEA